jgi:hypothetical protein
MKPAPSSGETGPAVVGQGGGSGRAVPACWRLCRIAYLMPSSNHETFRRRQMILVRIVAAIFILFGGGFMIYGLLGGD